MTAGVGCARSTEISHLTHRTRVRVILGLGSGDLLGEVFQRIRAYLVVLYNSTILTYSISVAAVRIALHRLWSVGTYDVVPRQ